MVRRLFYRDYQNGEGGCVDIDEERGELIECRGKESGKPKKERHCEEKVSSFCGVFFPV